MPKKDDPDHEWAKLLWPAYAAAEAGAAFTRSMVEALAPHETPPPPAGEQVWASPNEIVLQIGAARLRRFGPKAKAGTRRGNGRKTRTPVLVCAPFALHDARLADLCKGHSLMARLGAGEAPLYLVEWLSAERSQAFRGIDDYLADLNVIVDEIGGRCDFVGLCQGGWLSLVYAARFPTKAGKLAIAAAPIDTHAADSPLSALARSTPVETFEELVRLGEGLARGVQAQQYWRLAVETSDEIESQLESGLKRDSAMFRSREASFRAWSANTLNLPGVYYLEVAEKLYKRNQLACGAFVALGKTISLSAVRNPLYLIAARDDIVSAPEQTFACTSLTGTPAQAIRTALLPGGHLNLFIGRRALNDLWPDVVAWLGETTP